MNFPSIGTALLADRHHSLIEGVRGLLESMFAAVVMVADETSLFESAERLQPTVAVVDASLFRSSGTQWLGRLKTLCPDMALVVLSVHDEEVVRQALLTAGAEAVVVKRNIATDLLTAIEAALRKRSEDHCSHSLNKIPASTHKEPIV